MRIKDLLTEHVLFPLVSFPEDAFVEMRSMISRLSTTESRNYAAACPVEMAASIAISAILTAILVRRCQIPIWVIKIDNDIIMLGYNSNVLPFMLRHVVYLIVFRIN